MTERGIPPETTAKIQATAAASAGTKYAPIVPGCEEPGHLCSSPKNNHESLRGADTNSVIIKRKNSWDYRESLLRTQAAHKGSVLIVHVFSGNRICKIKGV